MTGPHLRRLLLPCKPGLKLSHRLFLDLFEQQLRCVELVACRQRVLQLAAVLQEHVPEVGPLPRPSQHGEDGMGCGWHVGLQQGCEEFDESECSRDDCIALLRGHAPELGVLQHEVRAVGMWPHSSKHQVCSTKLLLKNAEKLWKTTLAGICCQRWTLRELLRWHCGS
jgi:hypothetical protein